MDMLFNALQKGVPMASHCMQLNFGGGEGGEHATGQHVPEKERWGEGENDITP